MKYTDILSKSWPRLSYHRLGVYVKEVLPKLTESDMVDNSEKVFILKTGPRYVGKTKYLADLSLNKINSNYKWIPKNEIKDYKQAGYTIFKYTSDDYYAFLLTDDINKAKKFPEKDYSWGFGLAMEYFIRRGMIEKHYLKDDTEEKQVESSVFLNPKYEQPIAKEMPSLKEDDQNKISGYVLKTGPRYIGKTSYIKDYRVSSEDYTKKDNDWRHFKLKGLDVYLKFTDDLQKAQFIDKKNIVFPWVALFVKTGFAIAVPVYMNCYGLGKTNLILKESSDDEINVCFPTKPGPRSTIKATGKYIRSIMGVHNDYKIDYENEGYQKLANTINGKIWLVDFTDDIDEAFKTTELSPLVQQGWIQLIDKPSKELKEDIKPH